MKLFQPGKIGSVELKNRIVMAAMGTRGLCELDGRFNDKGLDYLVARARGGVGLITPGVMTPCHTVESHLADNLWSFRPRVDNVVYVPRLNEVASAVHHHGARICAQLTAGFGRVAHITVTSKPVAPSALGCFWADNLTTRALSVEEIARLIKSFGVAARVLKMAEWDAIELHGHEGYMFDQFQTALWNKRDDRYGGKDLDGRLTFAREVIKEIRDAVGNDLAIIYRYGVKHYLEGGREVEEGLEMAKRLEAAGVDALHVDAGCYDTWHWPHPPVYQPAGCMIDCAEVVKKVVKIPVIAVGKLGKPELAEQVLQEGKADFIALARPLLCDPDWANKVKEGKFWSIRPCIGDHECLQRVFSARTLSCTVNPQTGFETEYTLTPAQEARKVLVVGGGPGGLEAARVAALRGHKVTLWEKGGKLGGNLIAASAPDFKTDVHDLIEYLVTQIHRLGVDIKLGKEASAESVAAAEPDVAIVATGAVACIPEIPGVGRKNVVTAIDLLTGRADVGEKVIVAGGGVTGCEVAVWLARQGKAVTVVEMLAQLIPEDTNTANRMMLLEMIAKSGVSSLTGARIAEITGRGVTLGIDGSTRKVAGDSVVLAVGLTSRTDLRDSLKDASFEVHTIGDCVKPRKIINAIWEGFHASRLI
ncbi:MAG: FAD-dependent oxidoreductase [Chloroflexota bacterium]